MSDLLTWALVTATLRMTAPLLFAAMGGLLSERAGIMNIALEGFMLIGAFTAVLGTYYTGSPWIGLLCAIASGGAGAAIHAFWTITLKSDQIVTGTAINLLGAGIPAFLITRIFDQSGRHPLGRAIAFPRRTDERPHPRCLFARADHALPVVHDETRIADYGGW